MHRWPDRTAGPWVVELVWRILDGRPECVGLRLASTDVFDDLDSEGGGEPVTAALIRLLGIPALIAADRAAMTPAEREPQLPPSVRRSTADRFRKVAAVYRAALVEGNKPVATVAAEFGISQSSAANLVARARAAGFLPPASPGVATG